jgi:hypothetical protein
LIRVEKDSKLLENFDRFVYFFQHAF